MSTYTRETSETRIRVALRTAGGDVAPSVRTDDDFLGHMLVTLGRYAGWGLEIEASGDLRHHLIEDTAIALGTVLARDTPDACARYGTATLPMDDALVEVALDAGGRAHYEGGLPSDLYDHFFRSLALNAGWTLHIRVLRGRDRHHVVEAAFKALGLAVRQALLEAGAIFSTKGAVRGRWEPALDEDDELGPRPDVRARMEPEPEPEPEPGPAAGGPAGGGGAG